MDAQSPLSDADYRDINDRLGQLERLQQEIQRAALAGCDTADKAKACGQAIAQLNQIKMAYFPGRQ